MTVRFGNLHPQTPHQKELQRLAQQHVQTQHRLAEVQLQAESLQTAADLQLLVDACDSHAREGKKAITSIHAGNLREQQWLVIGISLWRYYQ